MRIFKEIIINIVIVAINFWINFYFIANVVISNSQDTGRYFSSYFLFLIVLFFHLIVLLSRLIKSSKDKSLFLPRIISFSILFICFILSLYLFGELGTSDIVKLDEFLN